MKTIWSKILISTLLAIPMLLIGLASFCMSRELHELADSLFSRLDVSAIFDFTLPNELTRSFHFNVNQTLSIDEVDRLSSEFVWGGRFARYYHPSPTVNRYQSRDSFSSLVQIMKEKGIKEINLWSLSLLASQEVERLKRNGLVGEFYIIRSVEKSLSPAYRTVTLSLDLQRRIDRLFGKSSRVYELEFSDLEKAHISNGRLTVEEAYELRAIRLASEIFEKNTVIMSDSSGGLLSNLKAELFGSFRQLCSDEAATYEYFLQTLYRRGLLRNFVPSGQIHMWPSFFQDPAQVGHVAARLTNQRTCEADLYGI